jgi:MFS family permease
MAVGLLYIGVPVGGLLASAAGGYIAQDYGWRAALLLAGIPGLIMAAVFFLTTKEPPRPAPAPGAAIEPPAKLGEVAAWLIGNPAILCLIMGSALIGLISITLAAWAGSFFIRIYGVSLKQAGFILGVTAMCIVLAPPVFGWLTDRLAPRFPLWPVTLTWVSSGLGIAMGLVWLFAPSLTVSIIASIAGNFIRSGYPPILYPFLMNRTPARLRGSVMSFIQLITNLIGFGIGPAFVGAISDYYGGEKAIRLALADALGLYLVIIALTVAGGLLLRRAGARGGAAALSA